MAGLGPAPSIDAQIIAQRAAGASQTVIAGSVGLSQQTVSDRLARPDIRRQVEQAHQRLLDAALVPAVDALADVVTSYPTFRDGSGPDDTARMALALKYADRIAASVGITPSHAPSYLTQTVYNQVTLELSPLVTQMLDRFGQALQIEGEDIEDIIITPGED